MSQRKTTRKNYTLWIIGGMYLAYTGYELCRDVRNGVEGGHWGFFVLGIVFAVIGIGLSVICACNMIRGEKARKEEEQQEVEKIEEIEETSAPMSIRERANLTKKLEQEE